MGHVVALGKTVGGSGRARGGSGRRDVGRLAGVRRDGRQAGGTAGTEGAGRGGRRGRARGTASGAGALAEDVAAVGLGAAAEGAVAVSALGVVDAAEAHGAHAHARAVRLGNLLEEAAGRVGLDGAVGATRGGVREVELLAGARDGDVGQAALLLELGRVGVAEGGVGEDALLHAGNEDHRELQALGGVDGHHRDGVLLACERVKVAAQGEPLHEGGELLRCNGRARRLP